MKNSLETDFDKKNYDREKQSFIGNQAYFTESLFSFHKTTNVCERGRENVRQSGGGGEGRRRRREINESERRQQRRQNSR